MADTPTYAIHHKRAEELLAELPDNSVDLILTDPPYYRVKDSAWDRQWKTPQEFLAWIGTILEEYMRVLKPNGSLYVFASPQMAARVEVAVLERFNVVNNITWRKATKSYAEKYGPENFRGFVEMSERIIFAEPYEAEQNFAPLVQYLREEREAAGLNNEQIDALCGWRTKAFHFFAQSASNFCLPTQENYEALRLAAPGRFLRDWRELRDLWENTLRRHFSVTADVPYTDVWDFPTVAHYPGKHECEKPHDLLQHIIKASSRQGAVVLDTFCGGGSTGEAALTLGRSVILCDADEHWASESRRRCEAAADGRPFRPARKTETKTGSRTTESGQVRLFDLPSWGTVAD